MKFSYAHNALRLLYSFFVVLITFSCLVVWASSPSSIFQSSHLYALADCSSTFNASEVLKQCLSMYHSYQ